MVKRDFLRKTAMAFLGLGRKKGNTAIGKAKLPGDAPVLASAKEVDALYTHELATGDTTPVTKSWMFTIHFKVVPPESDAQIYKNPLGLYLTDFAYQQEAVQADAEGESQ
jgi:hypothetical protein